MSAVPVCARDQWVFDLPAQATPDSPRRTETHWGAGSTIQKFGEGSTVTYEAEYTGSLGPAGQDDKNWHVLWQLHGPFGQTWYGPAMGLSVRHGELRLGGGAGRPDQDWQKRNYEWVYKLANWQDDVPVRVKVQTYLSSDPAKGWVSAWINGKQILNQVRPKSYQGGLTPGTFYPGMSWVASRTGLYRGTQDGPTPTYRQVVTARVFRPW